MIAVQVDFGPKRVSEAFQKAPAIMLSHARRGLDVAAARISRAARFEAPKAFSQLTNSIIWRSPGPLIRVITAGTDYADFVNDGTGIFGPKHAASGHMPPIQRLDEWVRIMRLRPRTAGMTDHGLAFVIGRKIAKTGTKADPFMDRAADGTEELVHADVHKELEAGIGEVLDA